MPIIKVYGAGDNSKELEQGIVDVTVDTLGVHRDLIKILFVDERVERDRLFVEIEMIRPLKNVVGDYLDGIQRALRARGQVDGVSLKLFERGDVYYRSGAADSASQAVGEPVTGPGRVIRLWQSVVQKLL